MKKRVIILLILVIAVMGSIFIVTKKFTSDREEADSITAQKLINNNWVAYQKSEQPNKVYIKNNDGDEERVLMDYPVLSMCTVQDWVYYASLGDYEGFYKIKVDGTENTKLCGFEKIAELNGSTQVSSEYENGYIIYTIQPLREVGDANITEAKYYKLSIEKGTIEEVEKPK